MMKYHRPNAPLCDEPILYRGAGLDGIYLCNGFTREKIDGEWFTHIEDIEGLHNAIALDLCARQAPLAGREIRFIRSAMDKTQAEIAEALGVNVQTVARWEKGESPAPGPADKMLRILFLASMVDAEMLLEYIKEVQEIKRLEDKTAEPAAFARNPAKEWGKVLEDA